MAEVQEILLGAFLATAGGLVAMALEKKWEHKKDQEKSDHEASALAFSALVKLVQIAAWYRKLGRAIDESFSEAEEMGAEQLDIGIKVKPLLGVGGELEKLNPSELALVLSTGDQGLLERVLQMQGNYSVSHETVRYFCQIRASYSEFIRENADEAQFLNGELAAVRLDPRHEHKRQSLIIELNQVVGGIIETIADDIASSSDIITRAQSALRSLKGLKVPEIQFQDVQANHAAD